MGGLLALALCVAFQVLSLALGADVNLGVNIGLAILVGAPGLRNRFSSYYL